MNALKAVEGLNSWAGAYGRRWSFQNLAPKHYMTLKVNMNTLCNCQNTAVLNAFHLVDMNDGIYYSHFWEEKL